MSVAYVHLWVYKMIFIPYAMNKIIKKFAFTLNYYKRIRSNRILLLFNNLKVILQLTSITNILSLWTQSKAWTKVYQSKKNSFAINRISLQVISKQIKNFRYNPKSSSNKLNLSLTLRQLTDSLRYVIFTRKKTFRIFSMILRKNLTLLRYTIYMKGAPSRSSVF